MKVRITSVPTGEAPLAIRSQWVGVELPTVGTYDGPLIGVLGGASDTAHRGGYRVSVGDAVKGLRKKGAENAADWWERVLSPDAILVFGPQFCELVE